MVFCYQNCSDHLWEQWKVRTIFGKQNTFLNCSWRFLRYQEKLKKTMYCPKMRLCNCKICLVCTCIPYVHTVYFFCTICTQGVRVLTGGQAASHSSSLFLFSYTRLLSGFIAFLKTNFNLLICNVKFHIFFFKFLTLLSNNESVNSSVQGGCREKSHICTRWCE